MSITDPYETAEYPDDKENRARIGQRLNDLVTARRIETYYWARGEWHIVLPQSQRIVLRPDQADLWISGFRHGLVAQVTS